MSKKHDKRYQLWVWYHTQNGDNPQNGYALAVETDSPVELFKAVSRLDDEDERIITQRVDLEVKAMAL